MEIIKGLCSISGFFHAIEEDEKKIVRYYGPELVTNGDFGVLGSWNLGVGWSIVGGVLVDGGLNTTFTWQALIGILVGELYLITFEIKNYVSGDVQVYVGAGAGIGVSANGVYSFEYLNPVLNSTLYLQNNLDCDLSVDNISVKQIINKQEYE